MGALEPAPARRRHARHAGDARPASRGRSRWCGRSPAGGCTGRRAPCSSRIRRRSRPSTPCSSRSSANGASRGAPVRTRCGPPRAAGRAARLGRDALARRPRRASRRRRPDEVTTRSTHELEVPLAIASDEELPADEELRRARAARARAALPAHVALRARDPDAAHAPLREATTGRARSTCDGRCAEACAPAGDPIRLARRRRRIARRRLVLLCDISGSMEPYARAYLQFLTARRQRAERRGVRLRHPADAPHARARRPQPGARDPARRRGRAGLVEWDAHRRRTEGVQRSARTPRHGPRRRDRDPVRRLGARRPDARRSRDGTARSPRLPDRVGQSARRCRRLLRAVGRHGRCAATLRRARERAQLRGAR